MGKPPCNLGLPLVPSKAALRALQHLAWSPSKPIFAHSGNGRGTATLIHGVRGRNCIAQKSIDRKNGRRGNSDSHPQSLLTSTEQQKDWTLHQKHSNWVTSLPLGRLNADTRSHLPEKNLGSGVDAKNQKNRDKNSVFFPFGSSAGTSIQQRRTSQPLLSETTPQLQVEVTQHACVDHSRDIVSKDLRTYPASADVGRSLIDFHDVDRPPWLIEPSCLRASILADQNLSNRFYDVTTPSLVAPTTLDDFPTSSQHASQKLKILLGSETHDRILEFVLQEHRHLSFEVARWHSVLRYFLAQPTDNRMTIAAAIVSMYRPLFPIESCTFPSVLEIVKHHLSDESSLEQASELLFPSNLTNSSESSQKTSDPFLAVAYLKNCLESGDTFESWIAQMRTVLEVAKLSGFPLGDDFAIAIIKALCHVGNMDKVLLTLDELEKQYGIAVTQDSLEDLCNGYAVAGDWKEASSVIELMHNKGYARKHPDRFQTFYAKLIALFSKDSTAERCLGFTIHAMKNSGLIPGNEVSRAITCASIRDGRHELILEWGRLVEKVYSRLEPPFTTLKGALQFSRACRDIGASCVEIASACRAIGHRARKDPFSKYFRSCVSGLVREDLIYRLQAINRLNQSFPDDFESKSTSELVTLAREIEHNSSTVHRMRPSEAKLHRDLVWQIDALEELKTIFEGGVSTTDLYESDESRRKTPSYRELRRPSTESSRSHRQLPESAPESMQQERLPACPEIIDAISNDYARRRKHSRVLEHALLKHVVQRLARCFRGADAIRLICTIYESDFVKGVHGLPFDEEIFTEWIHLALESGIQDTMRAIWAIIDSIRSLEFSHDFRLLTLLAFVTENRRLSGFESREWSWKEHRDGELEYAYSKLAAARGRDPSRTTHSNIFPAWKRWEEAMRDRVATEQGNLYGRAGGWNS